MPTIYDVAKAAGVSPKTVSRVLNDEVYVRESTRQKVLTAVQALDYRYNFNARQMRTQKSEAIALITDDISISPYAVDIIRGAFNKAWEHHKLLLVINTERNPEIKTVALDMMLERQIEGVIYATTYHRQANPPQTIYKLPAVLLDCFIQDRSLPSVVPDEVTGAYTATKTLLDKGHRRIGFVQNAEPIPATFGRLQGYRQALIEFELPFDPALVVSQQPPEPAGGHFAAKQLLELSDRPTALFCFNDRMAVGVYRALRELNLSIPDDVAVVGFDNQAIICTTLSPALTTIQLPHYEMGQWAVEHLMKLLNHPEDSEQLSSVQHKIDCPLVMRFSA